MRETDLHPGSRDGPPGGSGARTIPAAVAAAAARWSAREAVVDGARRVTFGELARLVERAAGWFVREGAGPGAMVGLWAPNSLQWVVACAGAQRAGATVVPINSRLKGAEASDILGRTRCMMLMTVSSFAGNRYPSMIEGLPLPDLRKVALLDGEWLEALGDVDAGGDASEPDGVADVIFTSGTTGAPKGVQATHAQNVATAQSWADPVALVEADRYLLINPFFHSFGYKAGWLPCLLRGATAVCRPSFDAASLPSLIEEEGITVLAGAPTVFQGLLEQPEARQRAGSLRAAITGAASVPPALIRRLRQEIGIPFVLTGYGLTEATGVVTMSDAGDSAEVAALTAGRPVPGVEVRIAGEGAVPVPDGGEGEVMVRGYNVMAGYFEDEEATARALDAEGWLHTGDVGRLTAEGCLQITDRLKDMYISGGFNCYPAEIERLLANHPGVAQAAVVGIPDDRLGEVGRAFVTPRSGASLDAEEVVAWAKANMANYKVPRSVLVVEELPVNSSGKVQKFSLRDAAAAGGAA